MIKMVRAQGGGAFSKRRRGSATSERRKSPDNAVDRAIFIIPHSNDEIKKPRGLSLGFFYDLVNLRP
ncbi:hypothetical protein DOE51_06060 [Bdellovibrio sp. NC01]|nr:hypothetical protein DOE51_06060 [Bdellovibrio sp. NC01]